MGIDIYLRWDDQTEEEQQAQFTGFDIAAGEVGYLREAYHGVPYATKTLFEEGWKSDASTVEIANKILQERLPSAQEDCRIRYAGQDVVTDVVKSFQDFVDLHRQMEDAGRNPRIVCSY